MKSLILICVFLLSLPISAATYCYATYESGGYSLANYYQIKCTDGERKIIGGHLPTLLVNKEHKVNTEKLFAWMKEHNYFLVDSYNADKGGFDVRVFTDSPSEYTDICWAQRSYFMEIKRYQIDCRSDVLVFLLDKDPAGSAEGLLKYMDTVLDRKLITSFKPDYIEYFLFGR